MADRVAAVQVSVVYEDGDTLVGYLNGRVDLQMGVEHNWSRSRAHITNSRWDLTISADHYTGELHSRKDTATQIAPEEITSGN